MSTSSNSRLTDDEQQLLRIVWEAFDEHGNWPVYRYLVDRMRQQQVDTADVIRELKPRLVMHRRGGGVPFDDDRVALRIRGLASVGHVGNEGALRLADDCARTLGFLAREFMGHVSHPMTVTERQVSAADIGEALGFDQRALARIYAVLDMDSHAYQTRSEPPDWRFDLGSPLERYADVHSLDEYMLVTLLVDDPTEPPTFSHTAFAATSPKVIAPANAINVNVSGTARDIHLSPTQLAGDGVNSHDSSMTTTIAASEGRSWVVRVGAAVVGIAGIASAVIGYAQLRG